MMENHFFFDFFGTQDYHDGERDEVQKKSMA